MSWLHAEVIKVHHDKSRVDIQLDNGDTFKDCVMAVPLGSREAKEGYVQVCVGSNVIATKGYGSDWLVTHEVSQINKPNSKPKNEILLEDICKAIEALAEGLSKGGKSVCPPNSPLTNSVDMLLKAEEAKKLVATARKKRYSC